MVTCCIEEYVARRKKEDKLNEFDLNARTQNMKLCVDYVFEYFNYYLNITEIESLTAKLQRPNLIVLPELSLCSYMGSDAIWKYADENSQLTSEWAMEIAKKNNIYIAIGFLEKSEGDYYNSYLIADKSKVYGIVSKSEGESYIFKCGDFNNIISTPLGEVTVGICYDSRRRQ